MKSKLIACLLFTTMLSAILIFPPKSRADTITTYSQPLCWSIDNMSQYPDYRFIVGAFVLNYSYQEITSNQCTDFSYVAEKIYAIKKSNYAQFQTIYKADQITESSNLLISSARGDDYLTSIGETQLKYTRDPNLTKLGINFTISGLASTTLSLAVASKTYYYKNGTTKTVYLIQPTPAPKPKVTPTAIPAPKATLTLKSQVRLTNNKSQTITGTSSTIYPTDKLTLTGTASANAKITLTIHSTPVTADITADASGNWTYTLDPKTLKLANGAHTVIAIATATSGTKSDEVTLASFTLKSSPTTVAETTEAPNYFTTINIILFSLAVLLLAALIFLLLKRHKQQPIDKI